MKSQMMSGQNWIKMFGPISVQVKRQRSYSASDTASANARRDIMTNLNRKPLALPGGDVVRLGVARIEVRALGRITPGSLSRPSKKSHMIGLVMKHDEELAHRLAGRGPYRPTLEPFLEFVLTRAVPGAVLKRIELGLEKRGKQSAGRTRR